jgi:fused signal recognition particle receptor
MFPFIKIYITLIILKNTMFSKLKEKFKNWTKKIAKASEEEDKDKIQQEVNKIASGLTIDETYRGEFIKKHSKKQEKELIKKKEKPKEKTKGKKEIEIPLKFNVGLQKYEPDLENLKKQEKDFEKEWKEKKKEQESKEFEEDNEKGFFSKITSKISKTTLSEKEFEVYAEELEMLLLENNVALEVSEKIIQDLKQRIVGKELLKKEVEGYINETFKDIIREILIKPFDIVEKIKLKNADNKPFVILFCGINGSGKTTTIAKIAQYLKNKKISCILAAGDTFRAAAIHQLQEHGDKIKTKVISHDYGTDPASVGFDAIKYAEKNRINCVLIDTAGRMHTSKDLMREIEKIAKVCKPDLNLFVAEAITGNDAIEQAKSFNFSIGIDGIILTKQDIDEKGGTSLSVGYVTKKPILFLGTGQVYEDIEVFDKEKFIEKLGL